MVDSRMDSDWEIEESQRLLIEAPSQLEAFWNSRYKLIYTEVLEDHSEFGRHGVIAECVTRFIKTGNILDVGCGTGILPELLDIEHYNYEGVDISSVALRLAGRKWYGKPVVFTHSSFESFEPVKKYDVIIFNEILYYIDSDQALKRCHQMLEKGGLIIISVFHSVSGALLVERLKQRITTLVEVDIENLWQNRRWHVFSGLLDSGGRK